jgi:glycosyltransferase involved in cell wall biosynthesis
VEVIPFCLNTQIYKPIDQKVARELLNLPKNKKLILFGAIAATTDQRKGFPLLLKALKELSNQAGWRDRFEVVVFGASKPQKMIDYGFHAHYLGAFSDDIALALVYSSADVMVVPSLQESFGQTASEALACGTPVVAFNATGLKDIVDHQINGYLAKAYESEDLANGIAWVLENQDRHQRLRANARKKAEEKFALELQAQRYLELFHEIVKADGVTH